MMADIASDVFSLLPALFPAAFHGSCSRLGLCCWPLDREAVLEGGVWGGGNAPFFVPKVLFRGIVPSLQNIARF